MAVGYDETPYPPLDVKSFRGGFDIALKYLYFLPFNASDSQALRVEVAR
ncbi:MAG TPA: hypothetical protein VHP11_15465 [Tepidisphaeraceae bacterium]|nr:hypothetical protein [Tepidisphaeraceae bacterium]